MAEFQQIVYAQYGNPRSFYANIQYGNAPKLLQIYGAWPEDKPPQPDMLTGDWQDQVITGNRLPETYTSEISSRIEIIKNLKVQVEVENDLRAKNLLREQLSIERKAKERAFRLKAMVDEEETLFILLN